MLREPRSLAHLDVPRPQGALPKIKSIRKTPAGYYSTTYSRAENVAEHVHHLPLLFLIVLTLLRLLKL